MKPETRQATTFLILRAQSGDRVAFDQLLDQYQTQLWSFASRVLGDASAAEDVLQDVFWIIYKKLKWLSDPALFKPWAYRITTRECFRYIKKRARWPMQLDEEAFDAIAANDTSTDIDPRSALLPEMLAELSPASRVVILLHYFDDLTLAEVADVLDISVGTVKSRLAYGLAALRKQMSEALET